MDIKKTLEIIFHPSDLEEYLKEKNIISSDHTLKDITLVDSKTFKLTFEQSGNALEYLLNLIIMPKGQFRQDQLLFLQKPVREHDLSVRCLNSFGEIGVSRLAELTEEKFNQLLEKGGFARKTLRELDDVFNAKDFYLKPQIIRLFRSKKGMY